jgi:uncharacterized protein (TIGR03067 family)
MRYFVPARRRSAARNLIKESDMKTLSATILLFAATVLFAQGAASDMDKMQGTWSVTSLFEEGKFVPDKELADLEIIVEKDVLTVNEKGKTVAKHQLKLDPAKTPKAIDFTHLIGPDNDKTEPGIYVFEKDVLKVCLFENKKERPTSFDDKGKEGYWIVVLKRKAVKG